MTYVCFFNYKRKIYIFLFFYYAYAHKITYFAITCDFKKNVSIYYYLSIFSTYLKIENWRYIFEFYLVSF